MRRYSVSIVTEECSRQVPLADEKQAGDSRPYWSEASFQQIFLEHYASIVGLLHRLMGDRTRAEELTLEAFWRLYRQRPLAEQDGNIRGWLYRTATRLGIDSLRAAARREHYEQEAGRSLLQTRSRSGRQTWISGHNADAGRSRVPQKICSQIWQGGKHMRHPSEGTLRARIDGELEASELWEVDQHLSACAGCRERMQKIAHESQTVAEAISVLQSSASTPKETEQAWRRFQAQQASEDVSWRPGNALFALFLRHPAPAWSAATITALVLILVSFAPARSVAQRVLAMLRVQKIAVVPIDLPVNPGPNTLTTIRRLISDRIVVTLSP